MSELKIKNDLPKPTVGENFKQIKPESGLSLDQAKQFLANQRQDYREHAQEKTKEFIQHIPTSGGSWLGEVGNSKWVPDDDRISPDQQSMRDLKEKYGIDGIMFNDREPDFSEVAHETVKIENFTNQRHKNFAQADKKFAEEKGITPAEARQFRKDNQLSWHERSELGVMDLVPRDIHNAIPHSGGISKIGHLMRTEGGPHV